MRFGGHIGKLFKRRSLAVLLALVLVLAVVLFLRGPYISNVLKMAILSELQEATGRQVIARKILVNVFPLFVEARDVKVFDEDGVKLFKARRIKAYLGLSGLLRREITIRRLVVSNPELWAERGKLEEMARDLRASGEKKKRGFRTSIGLVILKEGAFAIKDDAAGSEYKAGRVDAEVDLRGKPEARFSAAGLTARYRGWPELKVNAKGVVSVHGGTVELKELAAKADGSGLEASGIYQGGGAGGFDLKLSLLAKTVKGLLGLESPGEGRVSASGKVKLAKAWKEAEVDLKLGGDFHLETLMEALRVSPEHDLKGGVSFDGEIKGPLAGLEGTASAEVERGSLFGVKLDKGKCKVEFRDGRLSFREGDVDLYGGRAKVEVAIGIPHVAPYSVRVNFMGVDSSSALGLVDLGWLGLSKGRVSGDLYSEGMGFDPEGSFTYKAGAAGETPIGRISEAKGDFKRSEGVVYVSGLEARSGLSTLAFDGYVDGKARELSFEGRLRTEDANDVASPYFNGLKGKGEFVGGVKGALDDPLVEGKAVLSDASVNGFALGRVGVELSYRKKLLTVPTALALDGEKKYEAKGSVEFPVAEKIFDFRGAKFNIDATAAGAEIKEVLALAGKDFPVTGRVVSSFTVSGTSPDAVVSGKATARDASVYGRGVSSISASFAYDGKVFTIKDAALKTAEASVSLAGHVAQDGAFEFDASSEHLSLRHVVGRALPFDYSLALKAHGRGTLDSPEVEMSAALSHGSYRGVDIEGGTLKASLKGRELDLAASLLKGRADVKAKATLKDAMPWRAEVSLAQGRLDFLLVPYFKEVPDDLLLNVTGSAKLKGDRGRVEADIAVSRVNLNMYRQGFTNAREVTVTVRGKDIAFTDVKLASGNTSLMVGGGLELGSEYDLRLEGRTSLALLSGVTERARDIRGDAAFVFAVQGGWDAPKINGGMTVSDASFSVKGFPQRFTAVKGYFHVDRDRVVVENLDAELGGGTVGIKGVVNLKGFKADQMYLESKIRDVTFSVSRRFLVNISGDLIARAAGERRDVAGDLLVNRAEYKERVEWKSWLVAARRERGRKAEEGWAETVNLNVRLVGSERIRVDNNIARAPVKVDLLLRGTLGSPIFLGRMESSEGKVFFRNSEFTILRATADFSESRPNDPFIALSAETTVKGYEIQLNLEGWAEQFDLALASDPPLEEVEILGLLTVGEFGQGLSGLEGGVGAAEATSLVTGQFQDVVEEKLKDLTGLDRFQIDPYVSKSTGAATARVTVSKRLVGEKLYVTYSAPMGSGEEQELKMEYVVTDNVSLIGGRDDLGSIGGDVRFRFRFK